MALEQRFNTKLSLKVEQINLSTCLDVDDSLWKLANSVSCTDCISGVV